MARFLTDKNLLDNNGYMFIIDEYSLAGQIEFSQTTNIKTHTSEKYIISINKKPTYFLKRIPSYASNNEILTRRSNLIAYLKAHNFECPAIIPAKNNLFVYYKDETWQLYEYIDGNAGILTTTSIQQGVLLVAKFHFLVCNIAMNNVSSACFKIRMFANLLSKENEFLTSCSLSTALISYLIEFCELIDSSNVFRELTPTWIHGDCSHNNMIYKNNFPIALVDFDNAHVFYRIRDLAEYCLTSTTLQYQYRSTNFTNYIPLLEEKPFSSIVSEYEKICLLTEHEKYVFPLMVSLVYVELVTLGFLRYDFAANEKNISTGINIIQKFIQKFRHI